MYQNDDHLFCATINEYAYDKFFTFRLKMIYAQYHMNGTVKIDIRRIDGIWKYDNDSDVMYIRENYGVPNDYQQELICEYNRQYCPDLLDRNWIGKDYEFFEETDEEWKHNDYGKIRGSYTSG